MRNTLVLCCVAVLSAISGTASAQDWTKSKWGPNDEIGAANYMTPELVVKAASLVKTGKTYALGMPVTSQTPAYPPRTYKITVVNLGQRATNLLITDTIPAGTDYVLNSATGSGELVDDDKVLQWELGELLPGASSTFEFQVTVERNNQVSNRRYGVTCEEGVTVMGLPVTTNVSGGIIYLPLVLKQ